MVHQIIFIIFGLTLIILPLAPVSLLPQEFPFPDLLICFIFATVINRPKIIPIGSILFLTVMADFFWYRPWGLWPLITLLSTEFMRWRVKKNPEISFKLELTYFLLLFIIMLCIERLTLLITFSNTFNYKLYVYFYFSNVLSYPIISAGVRFFFKKKLAT